MSDLEDIIARLSHQDHQIRLQAIRDLGRMGDRSHLPLFASLLEDSSIPIVRTAVYAIGMIGSCDAWPYLRPMLDHPSKWVRKATVEAVGHAGCADAVPVLVNLLGDSTLDMLVREALVALKVDPDFF